MGRPAALLRGRLGALQKVALDELAAWRLAAGDLDPGLGDLEPEQLDSRVGAEQLGREISLAAADVEHPGPGRRPDRASR